MTTKRKRTVLTLADVPSLLGGKLRPPLGVILGSPREVADFAFVRQCSDDTCYQMDLVQAERLEQELRELGTQMKITTAADLWDLPTRFQTLVYAAPHGGERHLKLDMIEQAYHLLRPQGTLIVVSPYEKDDFFPGALKKIYGKVHRPAVEGGALFWCQRDGDRPRRRHEIIFQVSRGGEKPEPMPSLRFVSRPGVFCFGRFDEGARALVETMLINPGDRVLDVGCGCGTNGIHAALESGPAGEVVFVDSNLRALTLDELNARVNGITNSRCVASSRIEVEPGDFDVVLANPPYFAHHTIAALFIQRGHALLRRGGRFYLVTRQPNEVGPLIEAEFGEASGIQHRGYTVFLARKTR